MVGGTNQRKITQSQLPCNLSKDDQSGRGIEKVKVDIPVNLEIIFFSLTVLLALTLLMM